MNHLDHGAKNWLSTVLAQPKVTKHVHSHQGEAYKVETPNAVYDLKIAATLTAECDIGTPELDLADSIWSLQRNLGPTYGEQFLQAYGPVTMTPKMKAASGV